MTARTKPSDYPYFRVRVASASGGVTTISIHPSEYLVIARRAGGRKALSQMFKEQARRGEPDPRQTWSRLLRGRVEQALQAMGR